MKHILSVTTSLMLDKSPKRWRQCPDMTIAVDWDVKHQFKQANKQHMYFSAGYLGTVFKIK